MGRLIRTFFCVAAVLTPLALPASLLAADDVKVGWMEISEELPERPGPFAWLVGDRATLRHTVDAVDAVARRDDLSGLVIRLKDAKLNTAQVGEIGAAIQRLRQEGKKVQVYSEVFGPSELLLGSYADEVLAQEGTGVSLPGVYMEEMYLADALAWLGVKAELVQIGAYKGANETMTRSAPSPAWDQNISALLDSMYENLRGTIARGRGLDDGQMDRAMRMAWMATPEQARDAGLIDMIVDLPQIGDSLSGVYGGTVQWETITPEGGATALDLGGNPLALLQALSSQPERRVTGPTIAIVHIDGPIVDGDSSEGSLMGGSSVGSRTIRNVLEEILDEDLIRGVVVRINSPGGSAIASDVIWQGLRRVAAKKPVWVSVGSMAASGGYYIAVAGDRIYVDPSSIVGSIGVVGGKYAMGGLYDKLKIHVVPRSRGPMAGMFTTARPWTDSETALVREKMTQTYDQFVSRVTAGRPEIDISKTAEGRLFMGPQAIEMKMADRLGGLHTCIADLAGDLGLDSYDVLDYPGPQSVQKLLHDLLGRYARAPSVGSNQSALARDAAALLRAAVGERAWPGVRDELTALLQLRNEPVILAMPRVLSIR